MAKVKQSEHVASEETPPVRGELVPRTSDHWDMQLGDPPDRWPNNLDTSTERGVALLLNSLNPPTLALDGNGQLRMRVVAFVCCMAEAVDRETGEVDTAPKTVLFDRDGNTFVTRSTYAPQKMRNYQAVFPAAKWAAGIPIVIREYRSPKTKNTSHVIEIDLSQLV